MMKSELFKIEIMEQIAERLEKWAKRVSLQKYSDPRSKDRYLLATGYYYSLIHPLEKFDKILLDFQYHKPELSKSLKQARDKLLLLAKEAMHDHETNDGMESFHVDAAQAQAEFLAKMLHEIVQMIKMEQSATANAESPKKASGKREVPWSDDPNYISASEAVIEYTKNKLTLSKLSKLLRGPDSQISYMRKGQRCRVHKDDFRLWARLQYPSNKLAAEIADEVMADREAMKKEIRKEHSESD